MERRVPTPREDSQQPPRERFALRQRPGDRPLHLFQTALAPGPSPDYLVIDKMTNPTPSAKTPQSSDTEPAGSPRRERLWRIIFRSDTVAGRAFDIALLWVIAGSVLVVML